MMNLRGLKSLSRSGMPTQKIMTFERSKIFSKIFTSENVWIRNFMHLMHIRITPRVVDIKETKSGENFALNGKPWVLDLPNLSLSCSVSLDKRNKFVSSLAHSIWKPDKKCSKNSGYIRKMRVHAYRYVK
jgi:hypothetical protein